MVRVEAEVEVAEHEQGNVVELIVFKPTNIYEDRTGGLLTMFCWWFVFMLCESRRTKQYAIEAPTPLPLRTVRHI